MEPAKNTSESVSVQQGEISDNLLDTMINAYANDQFENQHDNIGCCRESMKAALDATRPYLRTTEPVMSRLSYAPVNPIEGDLITLDGKNWRLTIPGAGNLKDGA